MRIGSAIASGARHIVGVSLQALLMAAIITALVFAAAAVSLSAPAGGDSVFAAKGGVKGAPATAATTATLAVTCNPCQAGTVVHFVGSGFDASQAQATLNIANAWTATAVAGDGTVSFDWPYFYGAGSYSAKAYQSQGNKMVLVAETTVNVE
jgi:hypothetical protein